MIKSSVNLYVIPLLAVLAFALIVTLVSVDVHAACSGVCPEPSLGSNGRAATSSFNSATQTPTRAVKEGLRLHVSGDLAAEVEEAVRRLLGPRFDFRSHEWDSFLNLNSKYTATRSTDRKKWSHSLTITGSFNNCNLEVDGSKTTESQTPPLELIDDLVQKIERQIVAEKPLVSRITLKEEEKAIIDMGANVGLKKGKRLRVVNDEGKEVGLLRVTDVRGEEADAKIVRGKGSVREGFSVKEVSPYSHILGVQYQTFPIGIRSNPSYLELLGTSPAIVSDRGQSYMFLASFIRSTAEFEGKSYIGVQLQTGYMDMDVLKGWQAIDVSLIATGEIIPELLGNELGFGAGAGIYNSIFWIRPPGKYEDKIGKNEGQTEKTYMWNWHVYWRFHLFVHRNVSLFADAAYYKYDLWGNYQACSKPTDAKEGYDIRDEWLEFDLDDIGGFTIRGGLSVWALIF